MFNRSGPSDYSKVNLDEYSDDENAGDDFASSAIRNQQVRETKYNKMARVDQEAVSSRQVI